MNKRLYRSRKYRVFGGVAGGLGEYFNIDPILMRVIFVVLVLTKGFGILLYIILWIVIPEIPFELEYKINPSNEPSSNEENQDVTAQEILKKNGSGRTIFGVILIAVGVLFFLERIIPSFDLSDILPIAIIVIGLFLVFNSTKK